MVKSAPPPRPRGTLTTSKKSTLRATVLRGENLPRLLSFSHKPPTARDRLPHGMHTVNAPTRDKRRGPMSTGSSPTGHGINAPKGQWGG